MWIKLGVCTATARGDKVFGSAFDGKGRTFCNELSENHGQNCVAVGIYISWPELFPCMRHRWWLCMRAKLKATRKRWGSMRKREGCQIGNAQPCIGSASKIYFRSLACERPTLFPPTCLRDSIIKLASVMFRYRSGVLSYREAVPKNPTPHWLSRANPRHS